MEKKVMEEKEVKAAEQPKVREYTKEEMQNIAHQLSEQNRQLYAENQKLRQAFDNANMANFFKRLDYLWNICHSESKYFSEEFKIKCGEEFMNMMKSPEENNQETKTDK